MSLIKKLAGETAIYGVSSILGRLLNYIIMTPFLTNIFSPEEYGVVGIMYAYSAVFLVFFTYRMETAFFRFGKDKKELKRVFITTSLLILGTTLILLSLLFLLSNPIASSIGSSVKPYYFRLFAVILAADALSAIPFARLRLINRPMVFAAIRIANILVNIFFILFFLWICPYYAEKGWPMGWVYNPEDRVQYVFIANLLASLCMLIMLLPSYLNVKFEFDFSLVKQMLLYAWPLIIAQLAGVLNLQMGIFFITHTATPDEEYNIYLVGIYNAAVKIPILMTLFTQAFNYAAEPFFFRNSDRSDSREVYAQVANAFTLVGAIAFLGIMLYLDIIQYLLGKDFREGLGIVPIFLLAYLFLGLFYNFSIWYKLADRTLVGGYIALIGSLITLVLNAILVPIPSVGIYGPAWAALACFAFMAGAAYWTGQKNYKIDYPIKKMALYIGVALTGYFISDYGQELWGSHYLIVFLANTLILLACSVLFYRIDPPLLDGVFREFKKIPPFKRFFKA